MNWLFRISTWKRARTLLALNFSLQAIILLGIYPLIHHTADPLDTQIGLNEASIRAFLHEIGNDGRRLYFINELTLDMLFPVTYALAYGLLMVLLIKGCGQAQTPLRYLALMPFAIALCDLVENTHILMAIHSWPILSSAVVSTLALANLCKHILTLLFISALSVLLFWTLGLRLWRVQPHSEQ